jgi:hypothetical protein
MSARRFAYLLGFGLLFAVPVWADHVAQPEGWKVDMRREAALTKQGLYTFTVQVRDQAGNPVDNANVRLRLHDFGPAGYRLVPVRSVGGGRYQRTVRLHQGMESPQSVRVVVEPGNTR